MKKLLLLVMIIILTVSFASCVESEQTKPEDVSEFATVLEDHSGNMYVRFDEKLNDYLVENHGKYTITRTSMSDTVWTYKFFDRMDNLIAYANVEIPKPDNTEV